MKEQEMKQLGYDSDCFRNAMNKVVQMIQIMIDTERPHDMVPAIFAEYRASDIETGLMIIGAPDIFREGIDRNLALFELGSALAEHKYIIYSIFMAAEAWAVTQQGAEAASLEADYGDINPSEQEDRYEIIHIAGYRLDGMEAVCSMPIVRDEENRINLGEPEFVFDTEEKKMIKGITMRSLMDGYLTKVAETTEMRKMRIDLNGRS